MITKKLENIISQKVASSGMQLTGADKVMIVFKNL